MATLDGSLALAVRHHQEGRLAQAEQLYLRILAIQPEHANALHLLGVIALQEGRSARAVEWIQRAIVVNPRAAAFYYNLGLAWKAQGQPVQAAGAFQHALQLKPDFPEARNNLETILRDQEQLENAPALNLRGMLAHQEGRPAQAAEYLQRAVSLCPGEASLHYNLGLVWQSQGRPTEACTSYRRALALQPNYSEALYNLALVLQHQSQLDEAIGSYRQAILYRPGYAEAHLNLGCCLRDQGRLDEAVASFRQALHCRPDLAEAHNNLGNALRQQGRREEAVACYRQAIRWQPGYADACNNLGVALAEGGKPGEGVKYLRDAVRLNPTFAEAHNNLGLALAEQGLLEEAIASYRQAIQIRVTYAEAYNNLGNVLRERGRLDEAVASFRQAIDLQPNAPDVHNNLGAALLEYGQPVAAVASYQQALRLQPDHAEAHSGLAVAWLLLGNFEQGWPEYEWRWRCQGPARPCFREPPWDGSPLNGQTILLWVEQGLGDTLQFIRYAPLVCARGGKVLLLCPPSLARLLARCPGIDELIPEGSPLPPYDVQASLLSLPGLFGTCLANLPARVPYLFADAERTRRWQHELRRSSAFQIGIAWQGSRRHKGDRRRSVPLAAFAPLAEVAEVQLFSLQKGPGTEQLASAGFPVVDLGSRLDNDSGTFVDTAAVMSSLDLVVTVDTAAAHLAGALGVPAWVALPFGPDWRWLLDRDDSPWYPSLRLFRQPQPGAWDAVFARMAATLRPGVPA